MELQLSHLSEIISAKRMKQTSTEKALHARFNVFTTVLHAHDEVRLHTRFMHSLLNPNEPHDCGRLFLDLFLDSLGEIGLYDHDDELHDCHEILEAFKTDTFTSGTYEKVVPQRGVFDISLEFENGIILIENKIWAAEQDKQLERYAQFLQGRLEEGKKTILLYLTLDGKPSSTAYGNKYFRVSYHQHILGWLEKCLQKTYSYVNINQVLLQYKRVVHSLCGFNDGEEVMNETKQFLREYPHIIGNLPTVMKAKDELYYETLQQFFDELKENLFSRPKEERIDWKPRGRMYRAGAVRDPHTGFILSPVEDDFTEKANFEIWIERKEDWQALYIGIESNWEKTGPLSADEELFLTCLRRKLEKLLLTGELWHLTDPMSTWGGRGWQGAIWPIGRTDILEPPFFGQQNFVYLQQMLNSARRKEEVRKAGDRIVRYISILREAMTSVQQQNKS